MTRPSNLIEWKGSRKRGKPEKPSPPTGDDDALVAKLSGFDESDVGNAHRFLERHRADVLFVTDIGWHVWSGQRWIADKADTVVLRAQSSALAIDEEIRYLTTESEAAKRARWAVKSRNRERIAGALAMAAPHVRVPPSALDADRWLLNTPSGTVDLRTGRLREHRREDRLTKMTTAGPGDGIERWIAFLDRVTAGDDEYIGYLRRMLGYFLTGSIREETFHFAYGTGGNGKGVFLRTISGLLGDYAITGPMDLLMATRGDRHPTELADLNGPRMVVIDELPQSARWDEGKLKMLTGGTAIRAREMRQDFFEFSPQFKFFLTGNSKPSLGTVDQAIRRRFHLLPFDVQIPKEERDPELAAKLNLEWPGILSWLIAGCLEWQSRGLAPPDRVTGATDAYLAAEDLLGSWIGECCAENEHAREETLSLFTSWRAWCEARNQQPGSQKSFQQQLEARGYQRWKHSRSRRAGICGLTVRCLGTDPPPDGKLV